MTQWQPYGDVVRQHEPTVTGNLLIWRNFHSPQLRNERSLQVWLPPDYETSDRHYPVLYMHDGQNLFDAGASFAGEWRVDETLTALAQEGLAAIVVGIDNTSGRMTEYNPYPYAPFGAGAGDAYLDFLTETVKPLIDKTFRTRPQANSTIIAGSSMGGLISLYGLLSRPEQFGRAGVFSPAFAPAPQLYRFARQTGAGFGRIYLDMGTHEASNTVRGSMLKIRWRNMTTLWSARRMRFILRRKGYREGQNLMYVEDPGAMHNESAWAARLPNALRFLLG